MFFYSFKPFANSHVYNVVSTLINVVKLDIKYHLKYQLFPTFSDVGNINVEIDNVDLTLFNIVTVNVGIQNIVLTLI